MSPSDRHASEASGPVPPDVPDIERRVRVYPRQLVGLLVLAVIPLLALLGILGTKHQWQTASAPSLELAVEYPGRMRVSAHTHMRITATNRSGSRLDHVRALLPESYLAGFATREVVREASADFVVDFPPLEPGQDRTVQVELLAERFGLHAGALRIVATAADTLMVPLRTFILP